MGKEDSRALLMRGLGFLAIFLLGAFSCNRESTRMHAIPLRMLWAWESPQDLRFLTDGEGVAFLAGEMHFEGHSSRWQPRRNPLKVNPTTPLMAVIRLECHAAILDETQEGELVHRAMQCMKLPGVLGIQIDFDAVPSERSWYAQAIRRLRTALPDKAPLAITALGSWCWDDPWIDGLPADEAVPMLFRMSVGESEIRRRLSRGEDVRVGLARHSWGVSTDEPLPALKKGRRIYVFHPGSWTKSAWLGIREKLR
ncbi:MAG: DUF3142 domain-containing protein [Holophagaceae bacterium]|nr:DUF3142 domain-containing protein [Holophagaceae bacterium]